MAEEMKIGCARPMGGSVDGPMGDNSKTEPKEKPIETKKEEVMIKVGQKAPDFTAPAYQKGKFINVKLSDYLGKWVVLCFYPGDFTFV